MKDAGLTEAGLLALYDRVAEAEDAIPRLRRFVLDLAVRGKLVPQDPTDEPAAVLLERIEKERTSLGVRKTHDLASDISEADKPFSLPETWLWVRLGGILTKLTDGTHHSPPSGPTGDFLYITAKNIKKEGVLLDDVTYVSRTVHEEIFARCNPEQGDILYIKDGATTGVVTINNIAEAFSMLSSVALLKLPSCLFNRLIVEFLRSPFFFNQMRSFMKGSAIPRVTLSRMGPALLPLPPLAEQHRIVTKVEALMALLDRLEAARAAREETRTRLTAATLSRLTEAEADTPTAARFALQTLPALTTREDQIKTLRQTILNLAVRGKLVEQDAGEEASSVLLERIEKITGKAAGTQVDEHPFSLPRGWAWSDVGGICSKTGSGSTPRGGKEVYTAEGVPFLRSQNVYDHGLVLNDVAYIAPGVHEKMSGTRVRPADLLLNITGGSMGRCCRVSNDFTEANVSQHVAIIRCAIPEMADFLHALVRSPYFQRFIFDEQTGAGRGGLPKNRMDRILVALPPLAEQHRIVAKVEELMSLCDRLETALREAVATRARLLDATLREALAGANVQEIVQ